MPSILIAGREMTIAGGEIIVARREMMISRHETIFKGMGSGIMGMSFTVGSTGSGFIVMGCGLALAATYLYPAATKRGAVCLSA